MAALGLAIAPSDRFSVGLTTRTFASGSGRFDGLTAIDVGVLFRPSTWLSVGLVGRDLFASRSGFGTAGLDLGSSLMLSTGLRPFGTDAVTLDCRPGQQDERPRPAQRARRRGARAAVRRARQRA